MAAEYQPPSQVVGAGRGHHAAQLPVLLQPFAQRLDRVVVLQRLLHEQHDLVESVEVDSTATILTTLKSGTLDYSDLPSDIIASGLKLKLFREEEVNLETAFMELTKGLVQ